MIKELKRERNRLVKERSLITKELKSLKQIPLRTTCRRGYFQYYLEGEYVKKKHIGKAINAAKYEYYSKMKEALDVSIERIDSLLLVYDTHPLSEVYDSMSEGKKSLLNISSNRNELRFQSDEQIIDRFLSDTSEDITNSYPIESDIFTIKGEQVRSKSEKIIADELYRRNIPYKYEKPLTLIENSMGRTVFPDFTVLNVKKRKIMYIEHLGIMDDVTYAAKAMDKISLYEKNNIIIGRDLIIFHENKYYLINIKVLNEYIEEYLE